MTKNYHNFTTPQRFLVFYENTYPSILIGVLPTRSFCYSNYIECSVHFSRDPWHSVRTRDFMMTTTYVRGAWCGHQTTALNKCHKSYTKSPAIYSSDLRELFLNLEDLEGEGDYSVCCRLNLPTLLSIKLQNKTKITKTAMIFFLKWPKIAVKKYQS